MSKGLVARASVELLAPVARVWEALTDPKLIQQYMFGTAVASSWKEGDPITWSGTWEGKTYEDKGLILQFKPPRRIQYSHFSPLSGLPDEPENYHTVTIDLQSHGDHTHLSLFQDGNATEDARNQSQQNWSAMLTSLKGLLES